MSPSYTRQHPPIFGLRGIGKLLRQPVRSNTIVHIENIDSQEIWIPLQASFAFEFPVQTTDALTHLYIDKGAGKTVRNRNPQKTRLGRLSMGRNIEHLRK